MKFLIQESRASKNLYKAPLFTTSPPVTHHQLLTTSYELPVTRHQLLATAALPQSTIQNFRTQNPLPPRPTSKFKIQNLPSSFRDCPESYFLNIY
jgi:hypothetical protein